MPTASSIAPATLPLSTRTDRKSIQFAPVAFFDQRATLMLRYDLSNLSDDVLPRSLPELLYVFIEPDGWRDNSGSLAWLKVVRNRLFVQTPKRYHAHIEWFINELHTPRD